MSTKSVVSVSLSCALQILQYANKTPLQLGVSHISSILYVKHHPCFNSSTLLSLCFQASELSEHFNGQDSHAAAHAQSGSHSHSRATHSLTYRNPSSISSSTHQTQTQGSSQHQPRVQAQASDEGVPPGLASTLEHIIGQLDILTQVSRMCVNLS